MIFRATPTITCLLAYILVMPTLFAQGVRLTSTPSLSVNQTPATVQADYIVGIVNSDPITYNEVKSRLIRYERRITTQGAELPSRIDLSREVLEDIIREKLQLKLAKETGIRIDDTALESAIQTFAMQNNLSVAELKVKASADGIGYAQIRNDILNQLTIQKLRERDVLGNIAVPDEEIEAFIKEQFNTNTTTEPFIDLAQILIALPEGASTSQLLASQERAIRILERARTGEDFYKLVRENSDAKDASSGGQMGLRPIDRYPTLFTEAVQNSAVGTIVGPIRSGAGFHILKLLDKQLPSNKNFLITQTQAQHILLRITPSLSESEAKAKLSDIKRRIESGLISFDAAAKEYSLDESAESGGDLGWTNQGKFVPEFEGAMNALATEKISEPIVTRYGVHLIRVKERKKSSLSPVDQRDVARKVLREKKFDDAYAKWIRELRGNAYIEYRDIQQ